MAHPYHGSHGTHAVSLGQLLEFLCALVGVLQVVQVRALEVALQLVDVLVQCRAQHVDLLDVLVPHLLTSLLELLQVVVVVRAVGGGVPR